MGRYASYGIIDSFRISLGSLNRAIRNKIWGKSLNDCDMETILSQFPIDIYDVEQTKDYLSFKLKDSVTPKEIAGLMSEFWEIYPSKFEGSVSLLENLSSMTMDELRSFAKQNREENFHEFTLYGNWYGMKLEVDGVILYPDTDVEGFLICSSYDKMIVEDDIEPFNFLTDLLRHRLSHNPLSGTLLSFLSR